jgi:hypothetical protein
MSAGLTDDESFYPRPLEESFLFALLNLLERILADLRLSAELFEPPKSGCPVFVGMGKFLFNS